MLTNSVYLLLLKHRSRLELTKEHYSEILRRSEISLARLTLRENSQPRPNPKKGLLGRVKTIRRIQIRARASN